MHIVTVDESCIYYKVVKPGITSIIYSGKELRLYVTDGQAVFINGYLIYVSGIVCNLPMIFKGELGFLLRLDCTVTDNTKHMLVGSVSVCTILNGQESTTKYSVNDPSTCLRIKIKPLCVDVISYAKYTHTYIQNIRLVLWGEGAHLANHNFKPGNNDCPLAPGGSGLLSLGNFNPRKNQPTPKNVSVEWFNGDNNVEINKKLYPNCESIKIHSLHQKIVIRDIKHVSLGNIQNDSTIHIYEAEKIELRDFTNVIYPDIAETEVHCAFNLGFKLPYGIDNARVFLHYSPLMRDPVINWKCLS